MVPCSLHDLLMTGVLALRPGTSSNWPRYFRAGKKDE
jgi:hypothetical protein